MFLHLCWLQEGQRLRLKKHVGNDLQVGFSGLNPPKVESTRVVTAKRDGGLWHLSRGRNISLPQPSAFRVTRIADPERAVSDRWIECGHKERERELTDSSCTAIGLDL